MATTQIAVQTFAVATSFTAAGGIAALSLFDIPELRSQPASRSLPSIRWLFSRGSHIFPTAVMLAFTGFTYLAYAVRPGASISQLARITANPTKVNMYLTAAVLNLGVAIWTHQAMIPTNFRIIALNERIGGSRSQRAWHEKEYSAGDRSAEDSINSKGDRTNELKDLTDPQPHSERKSTPEEDREADELLTKFGRLNAVRALFPILGGTVGLIAMLI